jgi:hypothetical protein
MNKYNSTEEALGDICRAIYILNKEAEFNASKTPEFNPNKHVILNKAMVEELCTKRDIAKSSFVNLEL